MASLSTCPSGVSPASSRRLERFGVERKCGRDQVALVVGGCLDIDPQQFAVPDLAWPPGGQINSHVRAVAAGKQGPQTHANVPAFDDEILPIELWEAARTRFRHRPTARVRFTSTRPSHSKG